MSDIVTVNEPTMIGLSEKSHLLLKRLKEDGHFSEMADAYRFGVALALAYGVVPEEVSGARTTVFSVATIDPAREIATAVRTILGDDGSSVYRKIERLAEWGVRELARRADDGEIDFAGLLREADRLVGGTNG
ncbi:hypothetical protein CBM2615_A10056 [Cupriavidus taiwanensis]|uniref:Uncharacterized protein n=1 Tax=Cupriavidus taiwanensis TaxID=164546 RepID=A0A976G065_9BURK|nr:hypothetical protein [Cupriavidus taiwanensis]SOZ47895.1 hypothetical protein CBM2614_A10057 [Cupriavidus taiwanensis]SOZ48793.1 hypothetical protein CBM2615_A10056 [Cupriavidus taiwanensis]SOZ51620.1 hypothetical protein CBM2613_A10056 [Cupriavidus taiwanensis]SPA03996.1 hypothetical protein CBM2625_A10055 [Cupriavidus taiwanensis]